MSPKELFLGPPMITTLKKNIIKSHWNNKIQSESRIFLLTHFFKDHGPMRSLVYGAGPVKNPKINRTALARVIE